VTVILFGFEMVYVCILSKKECEGEEISKFIIEIDLSVVL
jgi:hypothetical protein